MKRCEPAVFIRANLFRAAQTRLLDYRPPGLPRLFNAGKLTLPDRRCSWRLTEISCLQLNRSVSARPNPDGHSLT
ncbi:MAG: hypothetical protein ACE5JX_00550, partial [Acidobacteriota bacterium]